MKKIFTLALALLCCGGVMAQQQKEKQSFIDKLIHGDKMLNIMLDTRFDAYSDFSGDGVNELGFQGHTFKLVFSGEIVPGIRYKVRHRLNRSQNALPREGYSGATDHAWLAFDLGRKNNWTITAGKQSVQFGTFEYDYNPADIYMGTMCFNDLDAYKAGVNVAYRFLGQTLNVQLFNSDSPQFAAEHYSRKALAGSVLWEGDLWHGMVKTRWAYTGFQHTKKKVYNWVTAGVQLNINRFTAEADYYFGDRNMDYSSVVGGYAELDESNLRTVRDQSLSLNLKYDLGKWRPSLKGVWNDRYDKSSDRGAYENWGVQAVCEYYPFEHKLLKDLNFHFMYGYNDTSFMGDYRAKSNSDAHTLLVGVRWLFNVK